MSAFRDDYGIRPWTCIVGAVLFIAAICAVAVWASAKDDADCKAKGGHMVTHTGSGTGVSSSGRVIVVTSTTSECVRS